MGDANLLDQPLGQLICCAAMIDDVASLVLLAMISSASGTDTSTTDGDSANDDSENSSGDSSSSSKHDDDVVLWGPTEGVWAVCIPLFSSLLFLGATLLLAQHMPSVMRALHRAIAGRSPPLAPAPSPASTNSLAVAASTSGLTEAASQSKASGAATTDDEASHSEEAPTRALWRQPSSNEPLSEPRRLSDRVLLALLFGCAAALTAGAQVCRTTALLGCFMAGVRGLFI